MFPPADALRAVAMHQSCGTAVDQRLEDEVGLRGSERMLPCWLCWRCPAAGTGLLSRTASDTPDRAGVIRDLLAVLA
jgi:hypothetical protein